MPRAISCRRCGRLRRNTAPIPLTVAKAYQSFQDGGYVEVRRGVGMFVLAGAAERLRRVEREDFVTQQWPRIRERIDLLDLDVADLLAPDRVG